MNEVEVRLPTFAFPHQDLENPCPCQDRPVELTFKICQIFWQVAEGERVFEGDPIAEIEAEKKTLALLAPTSGKLFYRVLDGEEVDIETLLAVIIKEDVSHAD